MNLTRRINAFGKLGNYINAIDEVTLDEISLSARNQNSWFTKENIRQAFQALTKYTKEENLISWTSQYNLEPLHPKTVAVVMAGNIPLVGFHDLISVLISGHRIQIKLSSKDSYLMNFIIRKLIEIEPGFNNYISLSEQLRNFDAVIATGSDNSSRYFHYYFDKYPHIIRKNRSSCAILTGFESDEELTDLGKDVFSYFGLGCRNVSKIYIPKEFDFDRLFKSWSVYEDVMMHHKYHNNYDYQKSIMLVNRVPFLDTGFVLLQENTQFVSPISVLFYEYYEDWNTLLQKIDAFRDKIQCVVGNAKPAQVRIGQAQSPELWNYADQVDTLKFLETLN